MIGDTSDKFNTVETEKGFSYIEIMYEEILPQSMTALGLRIGREKTIDLLLPWMAVLQTDRSAAEATDGRST